MNAISRIAAGLAFAATCSTAFAQEVVAPSASRPDAIATSPETAKVANDKAIKRSDTATVVRTGPTVADRARQASDKVDAKVDGMTTSQGTPVASDSTRASGREVALAPKADRN
ncbi:hypothetical protein ACG02S_00055 [Roseateles sp. DC23W]|uniref:DUF4148 domain-containing protein n=1 Tax=Pelomonas dachongensis TaxID=3299029 RepID=A0ABW7EG11_9BURK